MKRAFITGVTGQDGSYLADLLLAEGYEVFGLARRHAGGSDWRIRHLLENRAFRLVAGDVTDPPSLTRALSSIRPQLVFNLAAQSHVHYSWEAPAATLDATGRGVLNLLEAISAVDPSIRFYQASSSEMFGNAEHSPQTEATPLRPRSPYGAAKVFGHDITVNYRESYGLFAVSGILFNHESERRGVEFVTRKVTTAAARIKLGQADHVALGNLDASRDWGYAPDYVRAMLMMLRQDEPRDFVIATGQSRTIRELCDAAFSAVGLPWEPYVRVDERFLRPAELHRLEGDSSAARAALGWSPEVGFSEMIGRMVAADLHRAKHGIENER